MELTNVFVSPALLSEMSGLSQVRFSFSNPTQHRIKRLFLFIPCWGSLLFLVGCGFIGSLLLFCPFCVVSPLPTLIVAPSESAPFGLFGVQPRGLSALSFARIPSVRRARAAPRLPRCIHAPHGADFGARRAGRDGNWL